MSSHNDLDNLDKLFQQALRPYLTTQPPASVWRRIAGAVRPVASISWRRVSSWFTNLTKPLAMLPNPAKSHKYGPFYSRTSERRYSSPFVDLPISHIWDRRLAF